MTRQNKLDDRTKLIYNQNAHTEPVMLTYKNNDNIDSYIEYIIKKNPKHFDIVRSDNIKHTV